MVAASAIAPSAGAQSHSIIAIEAPTATPTVPMDVNNLGQVAGWYISAGGDIRAFAWSGGIFTDIGIPGVGEGTAYAINDDGAAVGSVFNASDSHAFLWKGGLTLQLTTLGGADAWAFGISNDGRIIGAIGGQIAGWDGGVPVDLSGSPPGFGRLGSYGYSINAAGMIAGGATGPFPYFDWRAARWLGSVGQYIGPDDSAGPFQKYAINDAGFIVGPRQFGPNAGLWDPAGVSVPLGIDLARDINNRGQVVGSDNSRAVLWEAGVVTDLNDLLLPDSGWVLQKAEAINDLARSPAKVSSTESRAASC